MHPTHTPQPKPVMDIAAPPKPEHAGGTRTGEQGLDTSTGPKPEHAPAPHSNTPALAAPATPPPSELPPHQPSSHEPLAVKQAPLPADLAEAVAAEKAEESSKPKTPPPVRHQGPKAPVVLITITIMVMLMLSGLAIAIYMTSRPN